MFQELLESLPMWGIFVVFALSSGLLYELGFRLGRWWQDRTPEETEGPTGMIVGSILALMAFLLAITMGMASDRFDARRGFVLSEANSIGTTYLRTAFLPEPQRTESRELLRAYVPLRIAPDDLDDVAAVIQAGTEILDELWLMVEGLAATQDGSELFALYVESLNDTIDMNTSRVVAALFARVPETVLLLLFIGSVLTLGMVGFSAGLTRRRSPLTAIVMIVVLGAVITLVVDIDRPQGGTLTVSQRPLEDLARQVGAPTEPE